MKKFWITVSIIAVAAVGLWQFGNLIPYASRIPYLSRFIRQPVSDNGGGQQAQADQTLAGDNGQHQGGGRRRGSGPTVVKTVAAIKTTLPMDVTASGWADADDNTTIAAQEQGLIVSINAHDGATVKAGDLIAKLDDRTARAAVDKDNAMIVRDTATLSESETALVRAQDLFDQKAGTQQSLDQARAARDTAAATVDADKATLTSDRIILENTDIRAPFDGRLGDIAISQGAFVNAGSAIVTIAKYDPIYVKFHLQERYLRELKKALAAGPVEVSTAPNSTRGQVRKGAISFYDNTVDTASGTILAKAKFDNVSGALWPGQSVNVIVHFNNDVQQVVVPTVAVSPGPDGFFAFVARGGKSHLTPVTVARANGGFTAIESGLQPGDHVVVEGQGQLNDQQAINEQFDEKTLDVAAAEVPRPQQQSETVTVRAQQ
ncbi:efflux RND transporter periplasmic adaptor subunit [Rhizobium bangladeshense]|uniref:efflux RND transporter periplasmic adaptor subunit n=1 Tax=Rhizobium bangladeshense TaxID=1138189 RepID=UPI001A98F6B3|nr:efflux RND transporter periplasmic adaptor subunit [Rhizobium bangladeshense]MBX4869542.1 efflux RND transporter periplasmic adaptor subunit [Rhizobium bangladeshense]MBX4885021.1 efflux RND transporter periplasmic adaptor subunit [Rhizobium bangladeshense]MBX4897296.1 efflux RND transporter periplasmic adaptor subunit [Rhizobium bangladeshense]MBX4902706.1 efflux RND transporter periplasmic adaptor subunit [Rhizobium bangladeshense]MBY3595689.1 efflux RND transporter periplasmic adaptor su